MVLTGFYIVCLFVCGFSLKSGQLINDPETAYNSLKRL